VKRTIVLFTSLAALIALAAFAPPAHARQSLRKMRIQACQDKSSGDPCTYTRKGQDVNGTCESGRRNKLICTATSAGANAPAGATGSENSGAASGGEGTMGGGSGAMGSPSTGAGGGAAGGGGGTGGTAP
jgi:hypothetical protein